MSRRVVKTLTISIKLSLPPGVSQAVVLADFKTALSHLPAKYSLSQFSSKVVGTETTYL